MLKNENNCALIDFIENMENKVCDNIKCKTTPWIKKIITISIKL